MISWAHALPSLTAAFLASLVEFVEALTVVLAVGTVRGWRPALFGTGLALTSLAVLVLALGPALTQIPLDYVQLGVGLLLLLFGLRWLRKAILRAAGVIEFHDEAATYAGETALLKSYGAARNRRWDAVAIGTSFKIVMLEGIEVVFIVIAVGAAGGLLVPAGIGAGAARGPGGPRAGAAGRPPPAPAGRPPGRRAGARLRGGGCTRPSPARGSRK